jgi:hypothetical protein
MTGAAAPGHLGTGGKRSAHGITGASALVVPRVGCQPAGAASRAGPLASRSIGQRAQSHGLDRGPWFYRLDASTFPHSNQHIHPVVRFLMSDQSTIRSSMASSMSVEARREPIDTADGEGTA